MGQSGLSSGREIMMDYLPALLVASLLGLGLADPEPSLAAVNRAISSFVHPSSSSASASQPTYNAPRPSYSLAASYSKPKPAYGAPPEDKCYINPALNKEQSEVMLQVQQLQNITFTPDPCLDGPFNGNGTWTINYLGARPQYDETDDRITVPRRKVEGEAHSYHYTNANKEPYIIRFNGKLISESFTPDQDEPYGQHGHHGRVKRQQGPPGGPPTGPPGGPPTGQVSMTLVGMPSGSVFGGLGSTGAGGGNLG